MRECFLGLLILLSFWTCINERVNISSWIIPTPIQMEVEQQTISLRQGYVITYDNELLTPLVPIFQDQFHLLTRLESIENTILKIRLQIDSDLAKEAYQLKVEEDISITGGSYAAVAMGLTSLLQLTDENGNVPKVKIQDQPKYNYRSLMVDLARAWHDVSVLKELIILCQWYKINYLHLHLTDDQSITFPSATYPKLATENRHYTKKELIELNEFAYQHGVILVPEIDVPGHSSQFIKKMPEIFGIQDVEQNYYTINFGKERAYQALDTLFGEVAEIFTYSPYIHIGGDEAFFKGIDTDPEALAYRKSNNIPNVKELFRHFLVRLNEIVKSKGKQTMVWAGFSEKGEIEIPKDIVVILWESQYYDPDKLQQAGYPFINASFKPLYVVNNRKWAADYIYEHWNPRRWESWAHDGIFQGTELANNNGLLGATMCTWEQRQWNELHRLRERIPAMNAHLWEGETGDLAAFQAQLKNSDAKLSRLLQPFIIKVDGLTYPDWSEGNFNEQAWFDDILKIELAPNYSDLVLKYSFSKQPIDNQSTIYNNPIIIDSTTTLKIAAFNKKGKMIGLPMLKKYFHQPLTVTAKNLEKDLPPNSWEKHRFEKEVTIAIKSPYPDAVIKYTLDGSAITEDSPIYSQAINTKETTHLNAQLFHSDGTKIGSSFSSSYFILKKRPSLTTHKPTTASNDHLRPNAGGAATNGRVTLWEMWGDHLNGNNWIQVDLEEPTIVKELNVVTFWDNYRYYQYTIDGSLDGENWTTVVDASQNTTLATMDGLSHMIPSTKVRFLKLNMLYNSANPGLHVVEFSAY